MVSQQSIHRHYRNRGAAIDGLFQDTEQEEEQVTVINNSFLNLKNHKPS
jgi:hypothetical protein